ncbi:FG-GAP-like repeat-containing protein [Streptomyces sp. P6-2-1]|uniref:FG-GAP-like repeat-containing protein n=1 Tax=unclassified Streptomyces TaxID=2593676 RepID=UPI003D367277
MTSHDHIRPAGRHRKPPLRPGGKLASAATLALSGSVLAVGVPALTATPAAAAAEQQAEAGELVVPAKPPTRAADDQIISAGATGWIDRRGSGGERHYHDAETGEQTYVSGLSVLNEAVAGTIHASSPGHPGSVDLFDPANGTTRTIVLPEGQSPVAAGFNADHILTQEATGARLLHILDLAADGTYTDRLLDEQLPAGASAQVRATRGTQAYLYFLRGGTEAGAAVLDWTKGTVTQILTNGEPVPTSVSLSPRWVSSYRSGLEFAYVTDLQHPEEPARKIGLPAPTAGTTTYSGVPVVVGDWLVLAHKDTTGLGAGQALVATSLTGKGTVTLAAHANPQYAATPEGGLLVASGDTVADWAVRRVGLDASGDLTTRVVKALPQDSRPYQGMALAGGRLSLVERDPNTNLPQLVQQDLTTSGALATSGPQSRLGMPVYGGVSNSCGTDCYALFGTSTGRVAYDYGEEAILPTSSNTFKALRAGKDVTVTDAFGRWVLMKEKETGQYHVGDAEANAVVHSFDARAAAVWSNKVWMTADTKGGVVSYDLKTKKTSAVVDLGSGTRPNAIQVVGRWIYWTTGGTAGVYDQTTKKNITVPASGDARIGDGFLVRYTGKDLQLTDFHSGGGHAATTSTVAEVPNTLRAGVGWTVDPLGGGFAYTDARHNVHVRRVSVPPSPIANAESVTTGTYYSLLNGNTWTGTWQLTRPATAWRLEIRDAWNKIVATDEGTSRTGTQITASWNGLVNGKKAVNGKYTYVLRAKGVGDSDYRSLVSGTTETAYGAAAFHSVFHDAGGQVLTLNSKGQLTAHTFDGADHTKRTASGWPTTSTFVPFGDALGEGGNDLIVRDQSGKAYRYGGNGSGPILPGADKVVVGTGWNVYDTLTHPGDLNKDGLPDLVARRSDNGDVYAFYGTKDGKLSAEKKLATNWKSYTHIVGAGDLDGDGNGDLVARDKDGTLYRFNGKGDGTFAARAKIFGNWGGSYTDIVGAGDLTGDGLPDLVERDAAGKLWYNTGDGKGGFASARKALDTGWSVYKQVR